eukprot:3954101-Prymnesium_polylepis.1
MVHSTTIPPWNRCARAGCDRKPTVIEMLSELGVDEMCHSHSAEVPGGDFSAFESCDPWNVARERCYGDLHKG